MADRPILFSGPMVRALLDGRKTQTRRVLKLPTDHVWKDESRGVVTYERNGRDYDVNELHYGFRVGDHLWVRESWRTGLAYEDLAPSEMGGEEQVLFEADGATERWTRGSSEPGRLRPGMHMPRWASRLTLAVTDVRVQRVQEISREDAIAEGLTLASNAIEEFWRWPSPYDAGLWLSPGAAYAWLWGKINAERGYGWDANPWVVAVSFEVHHGNIDQIERAA